MLQIWIAFSRWILTGWLESSTSACFLVWLQQLKLPTLACFTFTRVYYYLSAFRSFGSVLCETCLGVRGQTKRKKQKKIRKFCYFLLSCLYVQSKCWKVKGEFKWKKKKLMKMLFLLKFSYGRNLKKWRWTGEVILGCVVINKGESTIKPFLPSLFLPFLFNHTAILILVSNVGHRYRWHSLPNELRAQFGMSQEHTRFKRR